MFSFSAPGNYTFLVGITKSLHILFANIFTTMTNWSLFALGDYIYPVVM